MSDDGFDLAGPSSYVAAIDPAAPARTRAALQRASWHRRPFRWWVARRVAPWAAAGLFAAVTAVVAGVAAPAAWAGYAVPAAMLAAVVLAAEAVRRVWQAPRLLARWVILPQVQYSVATYHPAIGRKLWRVNELATRLRLCCRHRHLDGLLDLATVDRHHHQLVATLMRLVDLERRIGVASRGDELTQQVRLGRATLSSLLAAVDARLAGLEQLADAAGTLHAKMVQSEAHEHHAARLGELSDQLVQVAVCGIDLDDEVDDEIGATTAALHAAADQLCVVDRGRL